MSSNLKSELVHLEKKFSKDHPRFRVLSWTMNDVEMQFVEKEGVKHTINASISDDGDSMIWFAESDKISEILPELTENSKKGILDQVQLVVSGLCSTFKCPQPKELKMLKLRSNDGDCSDGSFEIIEAVDVTTLGSTFGINGTEKELDGSEESDYDNDETMEAECDDEQYHSEGVLPEEMLIQLQSIKIGTGLDIRLTNEVRELYQSEAYKSGMFTFEIFMGPDNHAQLDLKLYKGHDNKLLTDIMPELIEYIGDDYFHFQFVYNKNYPFEQMKIRIFPKASVESSQFPESSELRTTQFIYVVMDEWFPTMSTKSVVMQIADKMIEQKAFDVEPDIPNAQDTWGFSLQTVGIQDRYDVNPKVGLINYIILTFFLFIGMDVEMNLQHLFPTRDPEELPDIFVKC